MGFLANIELLIGEAGETRGLDLTLIGATQQVGHFQIASYDSAMTLALARVGKRPRNANAWSTKKKPARPWTLY